jgi:hypothetical protein
MFPALCVEFWKLRREVLAALRETDQPFPSVTLADSLHPDKVPSAALRGTQDAVLAHVDQDGFAFAVDPVDAPLFNLRDRRLQRNRHQVDIVIYEGRVCIRKRFLARPSDRSFGRKLLLSLLFHREAAALLRLRDLPVVPQIRGIDLPSKTIYRDYIQGDSLRHRVGARGEIIHDLDLGNSEQTRHLNEAELEEREIKLFFPMRDKELTARICDNLRQINRRGVALVDDINLGNVVVGHQSGCPYWIDLEFTHLSGFPEWEKSLRDQNLRIKKWFGISMEKPSGRESDMQ